MNLFLRVGLCIHFPNFQRKYRTIAYFSIQNNHRHLTYSFWNLKTCKNTSFGFTESESQVCYNNSSSRRSKLQKGELQIYISNGYQLCRSTALILAHNVSMKVPIIKVLNRYSEVFPIQTITSHQRNYCCKQAVKLRDKSF